MLLEIVARCIGGSDCLSTLEIVLRVRVRIPALGHLQIPVALTVRLGSHIGGGSFRHLRILIRKSIGVGKLALVNLLVHLADIAG